MKYCAKCGKEYIEMIIDGEFSRYTGEPLVARVCPDNHEGWKNTDDDIIELMYDQIDGWSVRFSDSNRIQKDN